MLRDLRRLVSLDQSDLQFTIQFFPVEHLKKITTDEHQETQVFWPRRLFGYGWLPCCVRDAVLNTVSPRHSMSTCPICVYYRNPLPPHFHISNKFSASLKCITPCPFGFVQQKLRWTYVKVAEFFAGYLWGCTAFPWFFIFLHTTPPQSGNYRSLAPGTCASCSDLTLRKKGKKFNSKGRQNVFFFMSWLSQFTTRTFPFCRVSESCEWTGLANCERRFGAVIRTLEIIMVTRAFRLTSESLRLQSRKFISTWKLKWLMIERVHFCSNQAHSLLTFSTG